MAISHFPSVSIHKNSQERHSLKNKLSLEVKWQWKLIPGWLFNKSFFSRDDLSVPRLHLEATVSDLAALYESLKFVFSFYLFLFLFLLGQSFPSKCAVIARNLRASEEAMQIRRYVKYSNRDFSCAFGLSLFPLS